MRRGRVRDSCGSADVAWLLRVSVVVRRAPSDRCQSGWAARSVAGAR
jgi:hypothetical protein